MSCFFVTMLKNKSFFTHCSTVDIIITNGISKSHMAVPHRSSMT